MRSSRLKKTPYREQEGNVLQGALKYTRLQVPDFKATLAENKNISDNKIKNEIVSTKQQLTTYEF